MYNKSLSIVHHLIFSPVHFHFPADDGQDHGHVAQDGEDDDGGEDDDLRRVQLIAGWIIRSRRVSNASFIATIAPSSIILRLLNQIS